MDKGKGKAKEKATKLPRSMISNKGKKILESVFYCPFCKKTASVTCTVNAELRQVELLCKKCDESYRSSITSIDPMPQPIDIYKEWTAKLKCILDYVKPDERERKKGREEGRMKNSKTQQLNPNWEALRQKLKSNDQKMQSTNGEAKESILGKRKERASEDEGNGVRPDPLLPTSSDSSVTDIIAMDCEMVGVSSMGNKSALGRVTLVNKWRNVVYDEFVRPTEFVVDFRTQVSGIRPRDLRKAKDFGVVQKEVAEMLKGKILVGHALRNDLKALLLSHPKKDIRDTSEYQYFHKEVRNPALRRLALEYLGVEIQNGEHCPIQDARAAMLLYDKIRKQWEKCVKDSIRLKGKQKKRKHGKKKINDNMSSEGKPV